MGLLQIVYFLIDRIVCTFCPPFCRLFSQYNRRENLKIISFMGGFSLGQIYYYYLLKKIPLPCNLGIILSLTLSIFLEQNQPSSAYLTVQFVRLYFKEKESINAMILKDVKFPLELDVYKLCYLSVINIISIQVRCISLLLLPMCCGKAGRGILKAIILTYVIAGPITNMCLNAKEVVRVFACTTQLSYNLSKERYAIISQPLRNTALGLTGELDRLKDALSSIRDISAPIEYEVENEDEIEEKMKQNDYLDDTLFGSRRSKQIEMKSQSQNIDKQRTYQKIYQKKLEYRCENLLTQAVATCVQAFSETYQTCYDAMPGYAAWIICWPLKLNNICGFMDIIRRNETCESSRELDPGLGTGYVSLKYAEQELTGKLKHIKLQYKVTHDQQLLDIQDAKETGERVIHAFEEKTVIMQSVLTVLNVFMALLFLRVVVAAVTDHDMYLTSIVYDNLYITGYFKELDQRRNRKRKLTLLPLKKVERMKYIDVNSIRYIAPEHSKLVTQMLKVMLEVVTATTFVMLDRLFYEALDVVRKYAETEVTQTGPYNVDVKVEGTSMLANLFRKLLDGVDSQSRSQRAVTNRECLPHPRAMPLVFYSKIYGGYLWILILLYINPYTLRLRRLICSYFYPRREKQRVLHLYNDILKKRMKMEKTLRRKAVQSVRAHYLSSENLLSLRIKFPQVLGWLRVLPAARMTCLICGETQPRNESNQEAATRWYSCRAQKCPFVYCGECWREAGSRCLACDPSLAELSDVDSLSDHDHPVY